MAQVETAEFPAVLIKSRIGLQWNPPVLAFLAGEIHSQAQLDARLKTISKLEALAGPSTPIYDLTLAPLADAEEALADIHTRLEAQLSRERTAQLRAAESAAARRLSTARAELKTLPAAQRATTAARAPLDAASVRLRDAGHALNTHLMTLKALRERAPAYGAPA